MPTANWITVEEAQTWPNGDRPTSAVLSEAIAAASEILHELSGRRYIAGSLIDPIPIMGKRAAKELSVNLALAVTPTLAGSSRLPERVTTVARQGLTYVVLDPQQFLDEGRLGLYYTDLFLRTVNPGRNRGRTRVFSADWPATSYEVRGPTPTGDPCYPGP